MGMEQEIINCCCNYFSRLGNLFRHTAYWNALYLINSPPPFRAAVLFLRLLPLLDLKEHHPFGQIPVALTQAVELPRGDVLPPKQVVQEVQLRVTALPRSKVRTNCKTPRVR